jgi:hypothetical protein
MSPGARFASMDGGEAVLSRRAVTAAVLGLGAGGVALRSTPTTLTFWSPAPTTTSSWRRDAGAGTATGLPGHVRETPTSSAAHTRIRRRSRSIPAPRGQVSRPFRRCAVIRPQPVASRPGVAAVSARIRGAQDRDRQFQPTWVVQKSVQTWLSNPMRNRPRLPGVVVPTASARHEGRGRGPVLDPTTAGPVLPGRQPRAGRCSAASPTSPTRRRTCAGDHDQIAQLAVARSRVSAQ